MIKYILFDSFLGKIYLEETDNKISRISLIDATGSSNPSLKNKISEETKLLKKARIQLEEYFNQKRKTFDLPLLITGSEFQKKTLNALLDIGYGEVKSYKEIAKYMGVEKAYRAVGNANSKNPIPFIIPCHRVISSNGSIGGYAYGLSIKKLLLDLEGVNLKV